MELALVASETEIVTVALRRVDPGAQGSMLDVIERLGLFACPTPPGATRPRDAVAPPGLRARRSRPTGSSSR